MNLTSPSQVKAWCIESGFHPNKVLGQNFLIDRNALEAIVEEGMRDGGWGMREEGRGKKEEGRGKKEEGRSEDVNILEIGPGLGVLTEEMLKRGCRVTAIEKDPVLAERLAASLGNPTNLTVIAADALDWIAKAKREGETRNENSTFFPSSFFLLPFSHMISNLPYQAGTRILLELVKTRAIPSLTALVQTEVAERLAAPEGSKTRGLAGVWAQLDYDVRVVRKVSASCFWPRPEVGSSVVRLDRHDRNADLPGDVRKVFFSLTKRAFEHRRKQLGSVFRDRIRSTRRAEELSIDDWIALAKTFAAELPQA